MAVVVKRLEEILSVWTKVKKILRSHPGGKMQVCFEFYLPFIKKLVCQLALFFYGFRLYDCAAVMSGLLVL